MKIRVGTFNLENLFMRYKFFYQIKSRKNLYKGRFTSLADIPTDNFENYIDEKKLERLYEFMDLPEKPLVRKNGKELKTNEIKVLAKSGKNRISDIKIKPISKIYDKIVSNGLTDNEKKELMKNLILYRTSVLKANHELEKIKEHGGLLNSSYSKLMFKVFNEDQRFNTAKVVVKNDPDILVLQEVENLAALNQFNSKYLHTKHLKRKLKSEFSRLNKKYRGSYPYALLVDAHDPRLIDVAVLSRYPIVHVRTHQYEKIDLKDKNNRTNWQWLFSRDCLEVDIALADYAGKNLYTRYDGKIPAFGKQNPIVTPIEGKIITIFANHLKSRLGQDPDDPQSSSSWKRRKAQADRVMQLVQERFLINKKLKGDFIIAGDLNDGPDSGALESLIDSDLWNIVEGAGPDMTWTHYYDNDDSTEQFDYLLISPDLKKRNKNAKPIIERRGLALYKKSDIDEVREGKRFDGINEEGTEASDHCAVFADLNV